MPPAMNAPADTWLMIRPPPRCTIDGLTARAHNIAPSTFTRITRSNHSGVSSSRSAVGISVINAALFTRMSTPPNVLTACSAIASVDAGSVMSTVTPLAGSPSAASAAAAASAASPRRSARTTEAPASASARP
jgi:hypothetical protein